MSIATPGAQPASPTSAIARRTAAICSLNVRFMATITWSAPTAPAAINAPSSTRYGLRISSSRSL